MLVVRACGSKKPIKFMASLLDCTPPWCSGHAVLNSPAAITAGSPPSYVRTCIILDIYVYVRAIILFVARTTENASSCFDEKKKEKEKIGGVEVGEGKGGYCVVGSVGWGEESSSNFFLLTVLFLSSLPLPPILPLSVPPSFPRSFLSSSSLSIVRERETNLSKTSVRERERD